MFFKGGRIYVFAKSELIKKNKMEEQKRKRHEHTASVLVLYAEETKRTLFDWFEKLVKAN